MNEPSTDVTDLLRDRRPAALGPFSWVGNDYIRIDETTDPETLVLAVVPIDPADAAATATGGLEGGVPTGDRVLAQLRIQATSGAREYRVDGFASEGEPPWRLVVPWGERGLLVRGEAGPIQVDIDSGAASVGAERASDVMVLSQGRWHIAVAADVVHEDTRPRIRAGGRTVAIAVDVYPARAAETARRLRADAGEVERRSRGAWAAYLESCPVVAAAELPRELRALPAFDDAALVERQLWHWRAARMNMVRAMGGDGRVFIAPDRSRWHGSWSSDGPITLSALALTSERDVAVEAMVEYIRRSIDSLGHLSWYTHSDGTACLGRLRDTGAFSHGLPDIVRAAEFIDRHHPSARALDATGVGDRSVYDTLAWYLDSSDSRDGDGDGLWETANLWESGWDNKVGPLFSSAPVDAWVGAIGSGSPEIIAPFLEAHRRPVVSMAEQFSYLQALLAMAAMAQRRGEPEHARAWRERFETATGTISSRHWDPVTSTYRDWDVVGQRRSESACLDGFYFLAFERDAARARGMLGALLDTSRFGIRRPPTLARDDPAFDPAGYWDGSHWPREMHYLALGLGAQREHGLAYRVVVDALMCGVGSEVLEHVNSVDGSPVGFHGGAVVRTQAMSVGLCLGLLELARGDIWWPGTPSDSEER